MFGKKKPKIEQPMTPEELSRYNDKKIADAEIEHFHVPTDSIEIIKYKKRVNHAVFATPTTSKTHLK